LWEVGGSPRFASSRSLFYHDCDGVIFVWDVSVEATYHSLNTWLSELSKVEQKAEVTSELSSSESSSSLPLLVVGSKMDKLTSSDRRDLQTACPQHVLVSSKASNLDILPFLDFFNEIYSRQVRLPGYTLGQGLGAMSSPGSTTHGLSLGLSHRPYRPTPTPLSVPLSLSIPTMSAASEPLDRDRERLRTDREQWSGKTV